MAIKTRGASPIFLDEEIDEESSNVVYIRSRRRIVFGWYGGKFSHLDWLLPLLPTCHHYCEPFSGSGAVLLNRGSSPVETYNDIDGDVVNFFRVLRDRHEELIRSIALTPFSREEYHQAIYGLATGISDVERARRFYIKARQTRTGLAQTASLGRWANCKDTSRAGMSGVVSRWLGGVDALDEIAQRLIRVQIENRPAVDLIRLYDSAKTLFYCDPPYLHATRGDAKAYGFEMDESQHREFAEAVNECKGMVAVSGYDHPLMEHLFPAGRWFKTMGLDKTIHSTKGTRQEVLWTNYDPQTWLCVKLLRVANKTHNKSFQRTGKKPPAAELKHWRRLRRRQCGVAPNGAMARLAPPQALPTRPLDTDVTCLHGLRPRKLRATGQRHIL